MYTQKLSNVSRKLFTTCLYHMSLLHVFTTCILYVYIYTQKLSNVRRKLSCRHVVKTCGNMSHVVVFTKGLY